MTHIMHKLFSVSSKLIRRPTIIRNITTTKYLRNNYEGDGKTTVTILNKEYKNLVMFDSYSNKGFRLNNGIFIIGPVAVFPRTILQWNVGSIDTLTPECFSLFSALEPKLDILILGTGNKRIELNADVLAFLKECKISAEVLPTEQACSTFNFLNVEGRYVGGAIIPPSEMVLFEEELKIISDSTAVSPFTEKI